MNYMLFTHSYLAIEKKKMQKRSLYIRQAEKILVLNPQVAKCVFIRGVAIKIAVSSKLMYNFSALAPIA